MKNLGALVGVVVLGLLAGCGPVGPEELESEAGVPEELASIAADGEGLADELPVCKFGSLCDKNIYYVFLSYTEYAPCISPFIGCATTPDPACRRLECPPVGPCQWKPGTGKATASEQRFAVYWDPVRNATCTEPQTRGTSWVCC